MGTYNSTMVETKDLDTGGWCVANLGLIFSDKYDSNKKHDTPFNYQSYPIAALIGGIRNYYISDEHISGHKKIIGLAICCGFIVVSMFYFIAPLMQGNILSDCKYDAALDKITQWDKQAHEAAQAKKRAMTWGEYETLKGFAYELTYITGNKDCVPSSEELKLAEQKPKYQFILTLLNSHHITLRD